MDWANLSWALRIKTGSSSPILGMDILPYLPETAIGFSPLFGYPSLLLRHMFKEKQAKVHGARMVFLSGKGVIGGTPVPHGGRFGSVVPEGSGLSIETEKSPTDPGARQGILIWRGIGQSDLSGFVTPRTLEWGVPVHIPPVHFQMAAFAALVEGILQPIQFAAPLNRIMTFFAGLGFVFFGPNVFAIAESMVALGTFETVIIKMGVMGEFDRARLPYIEYLLIQQDVVSGQLLCLPPLLR
jgi:hypothetical protein